MKTVMIAFDGSPSAQRALEKALDLFRAAQPEVVLVGALVSPLTSSGLAEQAFETARVDAETELGGAAEEVRAAGLPVRVRLVEGEPREVLDRVAREESPDVVVVGARGRGRVSRVVLGSVSSYAVHHLQAPILVVR